MILINFRTYQGGWRVAPSLARHQVRSSFSRGLVWSRDTRQSFAQGALASPPLYPVLPALPTSPGYCRTALSSALPTVQPKLFMLSVGIR